MSRKSTCVLNFALLLIFLPLPVLLGFFLSNYSAEGKSFTFLYPGGNGRRRVSPWVFAMAIGKAKSEMRKWEMGNAERGLRGCRPWREGAARTPPDDTCGVGVSADNCGKLLCNFCKLPAAPIYFPWHRKCIQPILQQVLIYNYSGCIIFCFSFFVIYVTYIYNKYWARHHVGRNYDVS